MLLTRNILLAVVLATMLALLISFLPTEDMGTERHLAPVFQPVKQFQLDENNLVDVMSLFDTRLAISHVQWQNNNLFIDYRIDKEKPIYVEDMYADLFSTVKSAFTITSNVKGLYLRILYTDKGKSEVLIALSSERSESLLDRMGQVENKKEFLQNYTTISYGVLWKENLKK